METEQVIKDLIGEYGWIFIAGFSTLLFKGAIENLYKGLLVFFGTYIKLDDIILYKGKKARVVRKGIFKTTIYIQDETNKYGETKITITNSELKSGDIEILLDYDFDKTD